MSFSSTTARVQASGNGSTVDFPVTFPFQADADLAVVVTTSGVDSVKTLNTDYTVSGEGTNGGGNVRFVTAPATGTTVTIFRDLDLNQTRSFTYNGSFPTPTVTAAADKAMQAAQQLDEQIKRVRRVSVVNAEMPEMAVADRASTVDGWDADGAPTQYPVDVAVLPYAAPYVTSTITSLRAISYSLIATGTQVSVTNYATSGDLGGGLFRVDKSDSTTADNSGTVIVATDGTRLKRVYSGLINPAWFGVTLDGTTDDTARMQDCLDFVRLAGGGTIEFPAGGGTMILSQSVKIGSDTKIRLSGCTVKAKQSGFVGVNTGTDSTTNCQLFKNYNHSASVLTDSDITIEGPGVFDYGTVVVSGGGTHCVSLRYVDRALIKDINGRFGDNVTAIRACRDVLTDNCHGYGQSNAGFDHWEGFTGVTVRNCTVRGDPAININQGIQFNSGGNPGDTDVSSDALVEGCRIYGIRSSLGSATALALGSLTATSTIRNFKSVGNYVEDADIGLNIGGNGHGHMSIGDTFRDVDVIPIYIQKTDGASPIGSKVVDPLLIDCANEIGSVALISISGTGNQVRGVQVVNTGAAAYEFIGYFTADSSASLIEVEKAPTGTTGRFFDQGTASEIVDTLDQYVTGTWTPELTFGGGSTGITYNSREGKYRLVGKLCFVTGFINLSSKGSSTGSSAITLPKTASANNAPGVISVNNTDGMASLTSTPNLRVAASGTTMIPQHFGATQSVTLTEGNFSNSSFIFFSGVYEVA